MRIPVLVLTAASAMVAALALPYTGFAPAGTVLRSASPRAAGLAPAPIAAFEQQVAAWTDPASGAGYRDSCDQPDAPLSSAG